MYICMHVLYKQRGSIELQALIWIIFTIVAHAQEDRVLGVWGLYVESVLEKQRTEVDVNSQFQKLKEYLT